MHQHDKTFLYVIVIKIYTYRDTEHKWKTMIYIHMAEYCLASFN